MTSHCDSHSTTDVKPETLPVVLAGDGIPHDKYNTHGIAHALTHRKDDIIYMHRQLVQRFKYIYWSWAKGLVLL